MRKRKTPSPWDGWDYLLSIMGDAVTLDIRWPITDYNHTSVTLKTPAGAMSFAKDNWPGGSPVVLIDVEEVDDFIAHISSYFAVVPDALIRQLQSARELIRIEDAKREARDRSRSYPPPFIEHGWRRSTKAPTELIANQRFILSDRPTALKASLVAVYLETDYWVHLSDEALSGPAFRIRVGQPCPDLAQLLKDRDMQCAAFVSACNPYSSTHSVLDNQTRQQLLIDELDRHQVTYLFGESRHPSEDSPGLPCSLVLNIPIDAAKRLGCHFEQNAVLWIGSDAVPYLVLLM